MGDLEAIGCMAIVIVGAVAIIIEEITHKK